MSLRLLFLHSLAIVSDEVRRILCRGVLNDIIDNGNRRQAFLVFNRLLREGGVLILDVREWNATAARKTWQPVSLVQDLRFVSATKLLQ